MLVWWLLLTLDKLGGLLLYVVDDDVVARDIGYTLIVDSQYTWI